MRVAYYPGCATKHFHPEMISAAMQIFQAAKINVVNTSTISCCGYPLKEAGEEYEANNMAQIVVKALANYDQIVTPCPTCKMVLHEIFPEKVKHMSEFLVELLQSKLNVKLANSQVNFHDPCHLGRGSRIFEAPRDVIKAIGLSLIEVTHNREASMCCGGPALQLFPDMAAVMADNVLSEMNAPILVTACPTCKSNLSRNQKHVLDIAEIVAVQLNL